MKIRDILYVVKKFRVPSRSDEGQFHLVELWNDNKLTCNCLAGQFLQKCRHQKVVENYLKKLCVK